MKLRLRSLFLTAFALYFALTAGAYASDSYKRQLEEKYGFTITADSNQLSSANADRYLQGIDQAFSELGASFVKSVCLEYKRLGLNPVVNLEALTDQDYAGKFYPGSGLMVIVTYFNPNTGKSYPQNSYVFKHEFGHAVNVLLDYNYGPSKLKQEWMALHGGTSYDHVLLSSCITEYAATDYREDFAETFAYIAGGREEHDALMQACQDSDNPAIGKKVAYLDKMLKTYFSEYPGMEGYGFTLGQQPSAWAKSVVNKRMSEGKIPNAFINKFQMPITRGDFCELLIREMYSMKEEYDPNTNLLIVPEDYRQTISQKYFQDVFSKGSFAEGYDQIYFVNKAYEIGLLTGEDGYAKPGQALNREQAATFLKRACEISGVELTETVAASYIDRAGFSGYAVDAISFVSKYGIMSGVGNNRFDPSGSYTYEQTYMTLERIWGE